MTEVNKGYMGLMEFLHWIQTEELGIAKDGNNPHYRSKYMTLDQIHDKVNPVLSDKGMLVFHSGSVDGVTTTLYCKEDKQSVTSFLPFEAGLNAQKIGAATTYYRRYNLCLLLNILADEDDDGNKASGASKSAKKVAAKVAKKSDSDILKETIIKEMDVAGAMDPKWILFKKEPAEAMELANKYIKETRGIDYDVAKPDEALAKEVLSKIK